MKRHSQKGQAARWLAGLVAPAVGASMLFGLAPAAAASPADPLGAAGLAAGSGSTGFTDKSGLETFGRSVVASGALPVADGSAPAGSGTTYYVDSAAGDDAAAGTSEAAPWRTFDRVNATVFQPGDRILLKAGSTWTASGDTVAKEAYDYTTWSGTTPTDVVGTDATALLAPQGSGTAGSPIVLSSYGDGDAPELEGRGVVNDVLQLSDQEHWNISNLEISNVTEGFDSTTFVPGSGNGTLPGQENPETGDLRGIHVQAENAGVLRGYEIHGVFVHDVSGVMWSISSTGLDRSKRTGGILFEGLKGDGETASQFEDIVVRDSVVANTAFANVSFKQFSGMGTNRYKDVKPGWGDRAAGRMSNTGVLTEDPDWRPHTNVVVTDNYLTNRDTAYGWDSLYPTSIQHATIAGNLIDGTGVSGIEMYYADDIVVEDNEVAEVALRVNAADSNGIDPDRGTSNILIQHNYVHDSGEGILLCGFSFSSAIVRYNVIQDVDKNYINPHGDSGVNVIYNNLMYNTQKPVKNNTVGFFESSGSASSYLLDKNRHHLYNNVFVNTRADVAGAQFQSTMPGVTYSNNSYFGAKVTAPAADPFAVTSDPKLGGDPATAIANAGIASADSPLISAGKTVDLAQIAGGMTVTGASAAGTTAASALPLGPDFFGATIGSPPNVGPTSYVPADGRGLVTGVVRDAEGESVPGASVAVVAAQGQGGTAQTITADARGRYSFEAAVGEYSLTPSSPGYASGAAAAVTLASGETLARDLPLGATTATTGTLAGTVLSSGHGVANATVTIEEGGAVVATKTTDAAGAFTAAGLAAGRSYSISAAKDGYQTGAPVDATVRAARTVTVSIVLSRDLGETEYAIDETFDDETTGAFTGTADGVLVAKTAPAVGTIAIVDDPASGTAGVPAGNKYLRINKATAGSAALSVYNAAELDLTGTVTIEARLARTTTNGTPNQVALYTFTEKDWNAGNPSASTNPSATMGFSGGKIITHNVTGSSTVRNVANYTVGQWYTIREVVDLDAKTFDLYLDDMTTPLLVDQPLRTAVDDLDYLHFFTNGSNVGDLLVDYVRVNTGVPYDYDDASLASVSATSAGPSGSGTEVELTATGDGFGYTGTVDAFADTVSIQAAPGSAFAAVTVNGEAVAAGAAVEVALATGSEDDSSWITDVPVVVTAENGETREYTVSISRTNPNQFAQLRGLTVTTGSGESASALALSPAFAPGTLGEENPYVVAEVLDASVTAVSLAWQRGWDGQLVRVNGEAVAADATSAVVDLVDGENVIEITASSFPGDSGSYVVKVTRAVAAPALDVEVVTSSRCIAGKVVLTATAANASAAPVALTLTSAYGEKVFAAVAPGKHAAAAFTTRLATLPAGSVQVVATATIDGAPVTVTESAAYEGRVC